MAPLCRYSQLVHRGDPTTSLPITEPRRRGAATPKSLEILFIQHNIEIYLL